MNFNKCERCGCFFTNDSLVCPNCAPKDNLEIIKLKDFIENNSNTTSFNDISFNTGISNKNLARFLNHDEFKVTLSNLDSNITNISINL